MCKSMLTTFSRALPSRRGSFCLTHRHTALARHQASISVYLRHTTNPSCTRQLPTPSHTQVCSKPRPAVGPMVVPRPDGSADAPVFVGTYRQSDPIGLMRSPRASCLSVEKRRGSCRITQKHKNTTKTRKKETQRTGSMNPRESPICLLQSCTDLSARHYAWGFYCADLSEPGGLPRQR
jgi:hypothetical protein